MVIDNYAHFKTIYLLNKLFIVLVLAKLCLVNLLWFKDNIKMY